MLIRSLALWFRAMALGCVGLLLGGLLVTWAGLWVFALKGEKEVDRAWGQTRESLSQFAKRFPASEPNRVAGALPRLSAAVGIDLSAPHDPKAVKPSKSEQTRFDEIRASLRGYLEAQLLRPDDQIDPLPPELHSYLASHDAEFSALRAQLVGGGPLRWRQSGRGLDSELPPTQGIVFLERVLLSDALERWRTGDHRGARDAIEVSWSLVESLAERPEVISQLVGFTCGNLLLGVLRKVDVPVEEWRDRFSQLHPRESFLTALEWEVSVHRQWAQRGSLVADSDGRDFFQPFRRPYTRLCMAGFAENMRQVVAELQSEDLCRYDVTRARKVWDRPFPAWDRLGHIAWPDDPFGYPWRLRLHLLQRELTLRVLEANETFASTGAWPVPSTDPESEVCHGPHWRHEVSEDGYLTIRLDPAAKGWPNFRGLLLPLEYCSARNADAPNQKRKANRTPARLSLTPPRARA